MSSSTALACPPELERLVLTSTSLAAPMTCTPLSGGVSSDIRLVTDANGDHVVAKRALPQLKVAAVWKAPVERSAFEAEWLQVAGELVPGFAPRSLGRDSTSGWLLLDYLEPERHLLWKTELLAGQVDVTVAADVARRLGQLHSATAARANDLAGRFNSGALFDALRLDPYLRALTSVHPELATRIDAVVERTATTRLALVHGDVSPKNILVGPSGPVLLDAECAWWGDPAFDLAFLLTHLVAKAHHVPSAANALAECARTVLVEHAAAVDWESPELLHVRVAGLLPAIVLARIDGKSPLEYLTEPTRIVLRTRAVAQLSSYSRPLPDLLAGLLP